VVFDTMSSRFISALAALPFSVLLIPYAYMRSREVPWYGVFLRPLILIAVAWVAVLFLPVPAIWLVGFVVIVWQSSALRGAIDRERPKNEPEREPWRR
jgi:hypothetical protein